MVWTIKEVSFLTYVMSDIHGDYSLFYNMLVKINFSSFDKLCAGNPYIKEKMDLDIDVARLKDERDR